MSCVRKKSDAKLKHIIENINIYELLKLEKFEVLLENQPLG